MRIRYHNRFTKRFRKLPSKVQAKFAERATLFYREPFHPLLNNHAVEFAYPNWRSINVTGDYRALFEVVDDDTAVFIKIGTHSELYG